MYFIHLSHLWTQIWIPLGLWQTCGLGFQSIVGSVVVETVSEISHLCWNNETIRFKSSLTSIIIESTYLTLNINKIWGCFKVQVGWKNAFYGETGYRKGLGETLTIKKHVLTFTLSVNKIIIYQFSMFKSLDSIASVVGIFKYLTISKFKQVLRSRKGLDYNTDRGFSHGIFGCHDVIPILWSVFNILIILANRWSIILLARRGRWWRELYRSIINAGEVFI